MKEHSVNLGLCIGIALLVLFGYFHPITALSQDLGRHIFTGELILNSHQVPTTNVFSYTNPDFGYINTHWLSQVVFALIQRVFGFPGLFMLMLLTIGIAVTLPLSRIYKKASPVILTLTGILYTGILFERTDLRPELFSFLLLSVFVSLLYHYREKPTRIIWLLIPLQLLWVNLHIYFAIGLVVLALFFIDSLIKERKHLRNKSLVQLGIVLILCCIVSLINPHGLSGLLYPLNVFGNYGYAIEENQNLFFLESLGFYKASALYLKITTVLLFLGLILTGKKGKVIDWLLAITFTYLAYSAVRNMPLLVFATLIPFTLLWSSVITKLLPSLPEKAKTYAPWVAVGLFLVFFIWQGTRLTEQFGFGYGVQPGAKGASEFLKKERITDRLFNNFDIGGYLIYSRYPTQKVFVDNRPEAYPASFFREVYIPMQENPELFKQVVARYNINTIYFSHTDQTPWGIQFLKTITANPDWSTVYLDDFVVILVRKTPEHEALIAKYGMEKGTAHITRQENTFQANGRIANFLTSIGWTQDAIPYYLAVLQFKPTYCPAIALLAQAYAESGNPASAIYSQQYTTSCY